MHRARVVSYKIPTTKTATETRADIKSTFAKWQHHLGDAIDYTISGNRAEIEAVIEYTLPGQPKRTLRHSAQDTYAKNLRVLWLALDDIRMADVRGMTEIYQAAYLAIEAPKGRDPYEVLGVRADAPREVIEASYKALARSAHPDNGGSTEAMAELNDARARLLS